jgi:hypothetical protein
MREWLLFLALLLVGASQAQTTSVFIRDTVYFMKVEIDTNGNVDTTNSCCERAIFLNKKGHVYWNDVPLKIVSNERVYPIEGKDTTFVKAAPDTIRSKSQVPFRIVRKGDKVYYKVMGTINAKILTYSLNSRDSLVSHVIYFKGGIWDEFDPKHMPLRRGNPFETIQFYQKDTTLSIFNTSIECYIVYRNYCCANGEYADHNVKTKLFIEKESCLPVFEERTVTLSRTFWNKEAYEQYRDDKLIRYEKLIPIVR